MTDSLAYFAFQILQIVWLDLLLSGDNAVVIALACRNLPEDKRKLGIALGAGMAVALRILFTLLVVWLLKLPLLKLIGGVLLLYIAIRLVSEGHLGLIIFGLVVSIPLVVFGAGFVLRLIDRWPIIVWAGAGLLGWVAGEMIATDPWVAAWLDRHGDPPDIAAAILGAVTVLAVAGAITLGRRKPA